jgi:DNA-binding SARP family transcriptional activator/SAM-dependent methyltransferase
VLGELCVERDGERLRLPPSRRTRALLAYLVLEPREHTRDRLVSLLWELSDDPRAALRWCLSRLRPVVDDESRKRLLADRERVRLDLSAVDFDLARGLALAERGLASGSRAALELALEAFRGELLEGLELAEAFRFQAWCTAQREAARRLHAQLLRALLDRVAGEPEEELQILRRLLELEPADEGAHRQAMRLLVALGRPRQALAEYDLCRDVLRSCLGAAPAAETEALRRALAPSPAPRPAPSAPIPRAFPRFLPRRAPQGAAPGISVGSKGRLQMIDETKLNEFMGKAVGDIGAAMSAALVVIGDELGLYKALANSPATPQELAQRTGTIERYVREWLNNQAASGYVAYDPKTTKYSLSEEQAMAFAQEGSPAFLPGAFQVIAACFAGGKKVAERFRTGGGVEWGDHDACLFAGTERFFRPGYAAHLVSEWLPALPGVVDKLNRGGAVADVGCGHGASTILMAQAFPKAKLFGFDLHEGSIAAARKRAQEAGVGERARFEVASASLFPGKGYDLVAHFDCLHDLGDPVGAARRVQETLAPDGSWMVVEPFANDRPEQNHNPVGRVFYAASTMLCVPNSLASEGPALGAQAGEARLREVATAAGFKSFRRVAQTPFNLVFEARL